MAKLPKVHTEEFDDEGLHAAQGMLDSAIIQALFHGRPNDDPAALEFIATLENHARNFGDRAPKSATYLRLAAKLARLAIGMPIKTEH